MLMSRAPPCSAGDLSTVVDTSLVTIPRSDSFTAPAEGGWSRRHGLRVIDRIVELVRIRAGFRRAPPVAAPVCSKCVAYRGTVDGAAARLCARCRHVPRPCAAGLL